MVTRKPESARAAGIADADEDAERGKEGYLSKNVFFKAEFVFPRAYWYSTGAVTVA